jgi:hypothetical protein
VGDWSDKEGRELDEARSAALQGNRLQRRKRAEAAHLATSSEKLGQMADSHDNPWSAMDEGGSPWDGQCIEESNTRDPC